MHRLEEDVEVDAGLIALFFLEGAGNNRAGKLGLFHEKV